MAKLITELKLEHFAANDKGGKGERNPEKKAHKHQHQQVFDSLQDLVSLKVLQTLESLSRGGCANGGRGSRGPSVLDLSWI